MRLSVKAVFWLALLACLLVALGSSALTRSMPQVEGLAFLVWLWPAGFLTLALLGSAGASLGIDAGVSSMIALTANCLFWAAVSALAVWLYRRVCAARGTRTGTPLAE